MEQLNIGTNDLPSVEKKKADAASVSSTEAFPSVGLALQLEVPIAVAASIPSQTVGEECWNSSLDDWLEAVVATAEGARLRETLPTASQVLNPYQNPVT
jgi:hypothetical protein